MKQLFLIHEHHPRLLLFFAGWGADETPFKAYHPDNSDFMVCYDYRTLKFDPSDILYYQEVNIIGWSMGVWAASQIIPSLSLPIGRCIAINGTPFPIDENRGIPPTIYQGTLNGLTDASLHKFLRRMCANSTAFRSFLQVTPRRPLEELREELIEIEKKESGNIGNETYDIFHWEEAVVGSNDRIIPSVNQIQAWNELGTSIRQTEDAHYEEKLFRHYLQELWIKD